MSNLKEIDPFIRMQIESINWTGYNAELIDIVVDQGKQLSAKVDALAAENSKFKVQARNSFWENFGMTAGVTAGACLVVGLFLLAMVGASSGKVYKGFEVGVQYSESRYRQLPPSQIEVSIKNTSYIHTKIDKSIDPEVERDIFEKIKNNEVYTVYEEK